MDYISDFSDEQFNEYIEFRKLSKSKKIEKLDTDKKFEKDVAKPLYDAYIQVLNSFREENDKKNYMTSPKDQQYFRKNVKDIYDSMLSDFGNMYEEDNTPNKKLVDDFIIKYGINNVLSSDRTVAGIRLDLLNDVRKLTRRSTTRSDPNIQLLTSIIMMLNTSLYEFLPWGTWADKFKNAGLAYTGRGYAREELGERSTDALGSINWGFAKLSNNDKYAIGDAKSRIFVDTIIGSYKLGILGRTGNIFYNSATLGLGSYTFADKKMRASFKNYRDEFNFGMSKSDKKEDIKKHIKKMLTTNTPDNSDMINYIIAIKSDPNMGEIMNEIQDDVMKKIKKIPNYDETKDISGELEDNFDKLIYNTYKKTIDSDKKISINEIKIYQLFGISSKILYDKEGVDKKYIIDSWNKSYNDLLSDKNVIFSSVDAKSIDKSSIKYTDASINESSDYTEEKFIINDEAIDRKNFLINENTTDLLSVDTLTIMKKIYIDNNFDNIDNIKSLSVRNYLSEFVNKKENIGKFFAVPLKREINDYDEYKYEEDGFIYYYRCTDIVFSSKSKFFGFGKIDIKMDYVLENVVDNSIINLDTSITDGVVIEDKQEYLGDVAQKAIEKTTELYNRFKSLKNNKVVYYKLDYIIMDIRYIMTKSNESKLLFKLARVKGPFKLSYLKADTDFIKKHMIVKKMIYVMNFNNLNITARQNGTNLYVTKKNDIIYFNPLYNDKEVELYFFDKKTSNYIDLKYISIIDPSYGTSMNNDDDIPKIIIKPIVDKVTFNYKDTSDKYTVHFVAAAASLFSSISSNPRTQLAIQRVKESRTRTPPENPDEVYLPDALDKNPNEVYLPNEPPLPPPSEPEYFNYPNRSIEFYATQEKNGGEIEYLEPKFIQKIPTFNIYSDNDITLYIYKRSRKSIKKGLKQGLKQRLIDIKTKEDCCKKNTNGNIVIRKDYITSSDNTFNVTIIYGVKEYIFGFAKGIKVTL